MALSLVTLTGTYDDGEGHPLKGYLQFVPSAPLTDTTDPEEVRQEPVPVLLRHDGTFSVPLYATDNANLAPAGWCWQVTEHIDGLPASSWSFFLASANGSTQDISALTPVSPAPAMMGYLPVSGGTLTGPLTLPGDPTAPLQAAPKQYVDAETARAKVAEALAAQAANNLSDLASESAARTNLGLGSAATLASSAVAQTANNLSDLESASAAITNLGLGTAATQSAAAFDAAGSASAAQSAAEAFATSAVSAAEAALLPLSSLPLSILNGGTGSPAQNFVDLTTGQAIAGTKTFSGEVIVPAPVNSADAATKAYVDASASGLQVKIAVQEATTAALPSCTYGNGSSGVGATLTATSPAALVVDGQTVALNDRVLVQNQAAPADNGIYVCSVQGDSGTPFRLTRSTDMNTPSSIPAAFAFVQKGSLYGGSGFTVNSAGPYTIGVSAITWTQFSSAGTVTAGAGLSQSGSTISLISPVAIGLGGTGHGSQQDAINALAGAVTSQNYLRGNGINVQMSAIQAADVPPLAYVPIAPAPSGDTSGATDTTALQNYLNGLPAGSDVALSTVAPYYINAALTVTKELHFHRGAVIRQVTAGVAAIAVGLGGDGTVIDGLTLTGPGYQAYSAFSSGITVYGTNTGVANSYTTVSHIRIRNNTITGFGAYGIQCWYVTDVAVHHNNVYNINYGGISFLTVTNGSIIGNRVDSVTGGTSNSGNCYGTSLSEHTFGNGVSNIDPPCENIVLSGNHISNVPWTGMDMHSGYNITITGNIVEACWFGIAALCTHDNSGAAFLAPKNVTVTGNVVNIAGMGVGNGTYGIIVKGSFVGSGLTTDFAQGITVTGNSIYGYGTAGNQGAAGGINLLSTKGVVVTGNTLQSCAQCAISVYEDNYNFLVDGNNIIDTYAAVGVASFAVLATGHSYGVLRGGTIANPGQALVQVPVATASVGQDVTAISTLTLTTATWAHGIGVAPTSSLTATGSVTVPATTGPVTLNYTGITSTTLTGVTTTGTGTILAGFAQQAPAHFGTYSFYSDSATNNITYWPGMSDCTTDWGEVALGSVRQYGTRGHTTTLPDAATIAVDASLSTHFRVTLGSAVGATRVLGAPANPTDGQKITIEVIQDATGNRALTYAAGAGGYDFGSGLGSPILSTAGNARDFLGFIYNSAKNLWYGVGFASGY